MAAATYKPLTLNLADDDDDILRTWLANRYAGDKRFLPGAAYLSPVAEGATDASTLWAAFRKHVGREMSRAVHANRKTIMVRLTSQDLLLLDANDIYRLCQGGDIVNPNVANNPAYAIPHKLRVAVVLAAFQLVAGLTNGSLGPRVAKLCVRAARIAQAASAQGQANIKLRVAARIEDANTSDDAAFNVAKDGEKAIAALNGAAAAERRRILKSKRKRGGAFAVAGSF